MDIQLNRKSETPLYLQISNSISDKFFKNEIFEGYQLPSERALANQLKVHRNTVIKAYEHLIFKELVVASRQKPRGYFIGRPKYSPRSGTHFFSLEKNINYKVDSYSVLFGDVYEESREEKYISFGGMIVGEDAFPQKEVKEILKQIINEDHSDFFAYCDPKGNETLRSALSNVLAKRNMEVLSQNIQIISETLQGISYIIKLYLKDGGTIIAEEPIVPEIVNLFLNAGVDVVTIPMENDGMNMVILEEALKKHKPKFIYTLPNFHIPTGISMSFEKRRKLLEYAYKYNIPIIEEDSQRELYYNGKSIPTLYAMDEREHVIYLDSFAFTFFPGALLGYMIAPLDVVNMVSKIIRMEQILVSGVSQYLTYKFLDSGNYELHISKLRELYKMKRNTMYRELKKLEHLGVKFAYQEGGLNVWVNLPEDVNERMLFQEAKNAGILIMPGYLFFPNGNKGEGFCRLCFSNVEEREIVKGVRVLGKIIEKIRRF